MLGHASAAMTLDVYADLWDEDLTVVALAMDKARKRSMKKAKKEAALKHAQNMPTSEEAA